MAVEAYREQTRVEDISESDIVLPMVIGMNGKIESLKIKFRKPTSIANPIYNDKVFEQIRSNYSFISMKCK